MTLTDGLKAFTFVEPKGTLLFCFLAVSNLGFPKMLTWVN